MTVLHLFDHLTRELQNSTAPGLSLQPIHTPKRQNAPTASHLTQTPTMENSYGHR